MKTFIKKQLILATIVYWVLLLYIIAALVWWFIALQQHNHQMTTYKLIELNAGDPAYLEKVKAVKNEERSRSARNIGEGATFLLLILVGAVFVYRAVRKQFRVAQEQQNFMMAITHELKTPLAVTRLNLETLLKHKLDEHKQQKLLQMTLEETERLNTLTNNILISSQLEGGGYQFTREEMDCTMLVEEAMLQFGNRFPNYQWVKHLEEEVVVTGDALLLQIMVNNLLENAVKYSPKGSTITVTLKHEGSDIVISVADEGAGIPEDEKRKIFRRFYRIGNEQTRAAKGTGLGLYLCKKIVADHGGVINVKDNQPSGSIFIVRLPFHDNQRTQFNNDRE
jgi:two-component system, OmpR family, sensor histidine kinase CiaH